mgnify:CR=1 FL=1
MNLPQRGEKQHDSIVMRVAATDKAKLKLAAQRQGMSLSGLIKRALMDCNLIDPINASIE